MPECYRKNTKENFPLLKFITYSGSNELTMGGGEGGGGGT